jgi:hypothetical protein
MINFFGLPSRVRRITGVYQYCIQEVVENKDKSISLHLKEGFQANGQTDFTTTDLEKAIYFLKSVTNTKKVAVAMFSFLCQLNCGHTIQKGQNYVQIGEMKVCMTCCE